MRNSLTVLLVGLLVEVVVAGESIGLIGDVPSEEFIRQINEMQSSWTAGKNFYPGTSAKNLLSTLPLREETLPFRNVTVKPKLPDSFDGRANWKRCKTVKKVQDQGNCASAWALVAGSVFSDRQCISKVGVGELSAQNILGCCRVCGVGCLGGYVTDALDFLSRRGTPTRACNPYELYPCPKISGMINCATVRAFNPICRGSCRLTYPKRQTFLDFHRSSRAYSVANSGDVIRNEILARGPVASVIDVYEDFLTYKTGVYSRTAGQLLAQHPVKVVGWGQEGETPYWIVLNTWGRVWGDDGVVKIARDTNGINLENRVFALIGDDAALANINSR